MRRALKSVLYSLKTPIIALIRKNRLFIKHRSSSVNVYHCCVQKTASQWIRAILSDPRTFNYSGLVTYNYQSKLPGAYDPRKITYRHFKDPFPRDTIVTPLYIGFEDFMTIPKPDRYKAFFVMRDPRDIVVSWYFSTKYSHRLTDRVQESRTVLNRLSLTEGMCYAVNLLQDRGLFPALREWSKLATRDKNVLLVRFEDLTVNPKLFDKLFAHCDIRMPENVRHQLLENYSFGKLSGRKRGYEEKHSHYRKGTVGDWKNYFNPSITAEFKNTTGDLIMSIGYENSSDW